MRMSVRIDHVFVGALQSLPPEGQLTGMFKAAMAGPAALGTTGLAGDRQGDPRHHGGVEKALHHYPAEHYDVLAARWPELATRVGAGVLGENLSTRGMTEYDVCIGDVYALGSCRIQVSQPRQPCWKINHRLEVPGASMFVAETGITGWYYRVLQTGQVAPGDVLELVERPARWLTLALYWTTTVLAHRPDPGLLRKIAASPGLASDKAARLQDRATWLEQNAC